MTLIILLIFVLIAAVIVSRFFRTKKTKHVGSNQYRSYRAERSETPRLRPNRYQRQSHREPTLGYKQPVDIEDEEELLEPPVQKMESEAPTPSDDPDVVLGLKEASDSQEVAPPQPMQMTLKPSSLPPPIITLHVMAESDRPYTGYELLQAILSVSMRYGKHQIFHRHQEKTGRGTVLFSLASVLRPGIFDLPNMGGFSTVGLSLFFGADLVDDPLEVYELMLETAGQLVEDLGGHVQDNNRVSLTPSTVVEHRRQLREYEESQCVPDLFES